MHIESSGQNLIEIIGFGTKTALFWWPGHRRGARIQLFPIYVMDRGVLSGRGRPGDF